MRALRVLTPLVVLTLFAACGSDEPAQPSNPADPVSAVDSTGTTIELAAPAERIACLTEPCVDALVELGLTPVAASPTGVASLPEFYGDAADEIPTIGGSFFEPAIEDVVASEPDLVIGLQGVHEPIRDALGDVPLYIVGINSTDQALEFLDNAGTLTGLEDTAADAAERFRTELESAIADTDADISVAVVFSGAFGFNINTTDNSVTAQMLGQIVDYPFSDDDADTSGGFAQFSVEQLLDADPDFVFVNTIADDSSQGASSDEVMAGDAVWGRLTAVSDDRVIDTRTPLWQYGRGTHSLSIILDEFLTAIS